MSAPTPRAPGWKLIANTSGSQGWHLVESTTPDRSVRTLCGIYGRVINETQREIVTCDDCTARAQPLR